MNEGEAAAVADRRRVLRRVRVAEVALVGVQLAVVAVLLLRLPAAPTPDELTSAVYGVLLALGVQVMVVVRLLLVLVMLPGTRRVRRAVPVRAGVVTAASPVLTWLVLLPWVLAGTFADGAEGADGWLLLLLLVMAAGLGLLATAAVLAPLEMAVRGIVAFLRDPRDASRRAEGRGLLVGAVALGSLTAFVLAVGGGADLGGTGRQAWGPAVAAMLGLPGDYTVRNPVLLWTGRVMLWTFLVRLGLGLLRRARSRRAVGAPGGGAPDA